MLLNPDINAGMILSLDPFVPNQSNPNPTQTMSRINICIPEAGKNHAVHNRQFHTLPLLRYVLISDNKTLYLR